MKAIVFEEFGEPAEVLKIQDVAEPEPGPGQVLVKMIASPINPSDMMYIRGVYGHTPELPATPGFEGVGVVESSGGGLLGKSLVGKRVVVLNRSRGNWQQKTVVSAKQAIPVSIGLTDKQAATFFVNPMTAWVMTREVLKIPKNEWLLQTAANSALGKMVANLGRACGFRTINIVRRPEQAAEIESDQSRAIVFDAAKDCPDELTEKIGQIVGKTGLRYAIDPVGGPTTSVLIRNMGLGGRILVFGSLSDTETIQFSSRTLITSSASVEGFWLSNYMAQQNLARKLMLIRRVSKQIQMGTLASKIGSTHLLEDYVDAVTASEARNRAGKVLIKM